MRRNKKNYNINLEDILDKSFPSIPNFSIDIELPNKFIVFVDGDQQIPSNLDSVFEGEIPIHFIVIVGPKWNNNFITKSYISYYRTNNFMRDSADLVITMLVSKYIVKYGGNEFYIISNDNFAEAVVDNLSNDNINGIVLKGYQNFIVDLITKYDYQYTTEYNSFREEIFKYQKIYEGNFLDNFMISKSIENIPEGITPKCIANTLKCNKNGGLNPNLPIYNELLELKMIFADLFIKNEFPIHLEPLIQYINSNLLEYFYIDREIHFFEIECIQIYFRIKLYGDYIYPRYKTNKHIENSLNNYLINWLSKGNSINGFMKKVGNRNKVSKQKLIEWIRNERKDYYPVIVSVMELIGTK